MKKGWQYEGVYFCGKPSVRTKHAEVVTLRRFDARGMRLVYHRGDHLWSSFNRPSRRYAMDVWLSKAGRVLVRFWGDSKYLDWCSFEVRNIRVRPQDWGAKGPDSWDDNERFIPGLLRSEYDDWVDRCGELD